MSKLLELQEALRLNIPLLTRELDMNDIEFLDRVYERECITENDYEEIRSRKRNLDKSRLLIVKIKDSDPGVIESFLDILNTTQAYSKLADKVKETLVQIRIEDKNIIKCVVCVIRENVDIHDIVDQLYKEDIISGCLYSDIAEEEHLHGIRQYIWEQIFIALEQDKPNRIKILKDALGTKHSYIKKMLESFPVKEPLKCRCTKRRGLRVRPCEDYASSTDVSTTSTIPRCDNDSALDTADYGTDNDIPDDDTVFEHTDNEAQEGERPTHTHEANEIATNTHTDKHDQKKESEMKKHAIDFVESQTNKSATINTHTHLTAIQSADNANRRRSLPNIKQKLEKTSDVKAKTDIAAGTENKSVSDKIEIESRVVKRELPTVRHAFVDKASHRNRGGSSTLPSKDVNKKAEEDISNHEQIKMFDKLKKNLKSHVSNLQNKQVSRARSLPPTEKRILVRISPSSLTKRKTRLESYGSSKSNPDLLNIDDNEQTEQNQASDSSPETVISDLESKPDVTDLAGNTQTDISQTIQGASQLVELRQDENENSNKTESNVSDKIIESVKPSSKDNNALEKPQTSSRLPRPRGNSFSRRPSRRSRSRPSPRRNSNERRPGTDTSETFTKPVLQFSASAVVDASSSLPTPLTIAVSTNHSTKASEVDTSDRSEPNSRESRSPSSASSQDGLPQTPKRVSPVSSLGFHFDKEALSKPDKVVHDFKSRLLAQKSDPRISLLRASEDGQVGGGLRRSGSLPLTENLTSNREGRKRRFGLVSTKSRATSAERRESLGNLRSVASTPDLKGFAIDL